jgi:hypothetical protein
MAMSAHPSDNFRGPFEDEFGPLEMDALIAEGEKSGEALDGEQVLAELRQRREKSQSNQKQSD